MSKTIFSLGPLELISRDDGVLEHVERLFARRERPSIYDQGTNWYADWYFALRLDEEISRSRRYEFDLCLVWLAFVFDSRFSPQRIEMKNSLANLGPDVFHQIDIPGVLNQDQFAVCLPQSDRAAGTAVAERLGAELAVYGPKIGLAVYPTDGTDAGDLIRTAAGNAVAVVEPEEAEESEDDGLSILER